MDKTGFVVGEESDCMLVDNCIDATLSDVPNKTPQFADTELQEEDTDLPPAKRVKLSSQTSEIVSTSPTTAQNQPNSAPSRTYWPYRGLYNSHTNQSLPGPHHAPTTVTTTYAAKSSSTAPTLFCDDITTHDINRHVSRAAAVADEIIVQQGSASDNTVDSDDENNNNDGCSDSTRSSSTIQNPKKRKRNGPKARSRQTKYMFSKFQLNNLHTQIECMEKSMQKLPLASQPEWIVTPLLRHQLQAMHWLKEKKCAILADDMGLGKTIQTLSILSIQYAEQQKAHHHNTATSCSNHSTNKDDRQRKNILAPSLVICPKSTISNWVQEAKRHVDKSKMVTFAYTKDEALRSYLQYRDPNVAHVVIVSYDQVFAAFRRNCTWVTQEEDPSLKKNQYIMTSPENGIPLSPFFSTTWESIVLDEAHKIKNDLTGRAAACTILKSSGLRLCLTGTPFQNSLDDFYSFVKFLRVDGYSKRRQWTSEITPNGFVSFPNLYKLMDQIMLRRMKNTKLADGSNLMTLPPVARHVKALPLTAAQELVQATIAEYVSQEVETAKQQREREEINELQYHAILLRLVKLMQQVANHPVLLLHGKESNTETLQSLMTVLEQYQEKQKQQQTALQKKALTPPSSTSQDNDNDVVMVIEKKNKTTTNIIIDLTTPDTERGSSSSSSSSLITMANTTLMQQNHQRQHSALRNEIDAVRSNIRTVLKKDTLKSKRIDLVQLAHAWRCVSNKLDVVTQDVKQILEADSKNKIVIFSQFVQMLNMVVVGVSQHTPQYANSIVRIDGSTSHQQRIQNLDDFNNNPSCRIMVISLGAGGVGLNLQIANYVLLLDLWWNAALEQQALDRVYRYGQTRAVQMYTYFSSGSIEEKVLAIQQHKTTVGNFALRDTAALRMNSTSSSDTLLNKKSSLSTTELEQLLNLKKNQSQ